MENVTPNLSSRAIALLEYIKERGGGVIDEQEICTALELSHGYFSAARSELVAANLLVIRRRGRQPYYLLLLGGDKPAPVAAATPARADYVVSPKPRARVRRGNSLTEMRQASPRIMGEYPDREEWIVALTDALGDVEVSEGENEEEQVVTILGTDEIQRYSVIDDEGGFIVT